MGTKIVNLFLQGTVNLPKLTDNRVTDPTLAFLFVRLLNYFA